MSDSSFATMSLLPNLFDTALSTLGSMKDCTMLTTAFGSVLSFSSTVVRITRSSGLTIG
jgi:hypothetical protein